MGENFLKIKKEFNKEIFVKSLLAGLSLGLFAVGLLMLILKLISVKFAMYYYAIIGVGLAIIVTSVAYIIFKYSDFSLAKKLDNDYGLNEKVKTMVEFITSDTDMILMQRANTEKVLSNLPKRTDFVKRFMYNGIALILSIAILITGLLVPAKIKNPTFTPTFSLSSWQKKALTNLIEEVSISKMQTDVKELTVQDLQGLLELLENTTSYNEMKLSVIKVIVDVDAYVEGVNTYKKICVSLDGSDDNNVRELALALSVLSDVGFGADLEEIRLVLYDGELNENVTSFADQLKLRLVTVVNKNEPLYNAFYEFSEELQTIKEKFNESGIDEEEIKASIEASFITASENIGSAISIQQANKEQRDNVKTSLMEIFSLTDADIPELIGDLMPELGKNENQQGNGNQSSGGLGEGENIYAGDDKIYDPFKEGGADYVPYGEAFIEYYKKVEELLIDGNLTEEEKKILSDYYTALSNGLIGNE